MGNEIECKFLVSFLPEGMSGTTMRQGYLQPEKERAVRIRTVEKDGSLEGLNIDLIDKVCMSVRIPVLALGGGGNWDHILEAFKQTSVAGVCTQNIYHFTEKSIKSAKKLLKNSGISVRF